MDKVKLKIERTSEDAQLPKYQYNGDSGADICSAVDYVLKPFEIKDIPTGIKMEVPIGYEVQVRSRSGLALNSGVVVLNSPGTVDSGYRGEIRVILMNLSQKPYKIKIRQRIAQLVLVPVSFADFEDVSKLSATIRGANGFGSTGH